MNLFFIEKYIKKIKKEDIYNYAKLQDITITQAELNILYNYLKTYYKQFITNPETRLELLSNIKKQVSLPIANKLDELYYQYKDKL